MNRHGVPVEHVAQRRWLPFLHPVRCRCGFDLPCPVQTSLARLEHFLPEARPAWNAPTTTYRPLLTAGQRYRTRGNSQ